MQKKPENIQRTETITFPDQSVDGDILNPTQQLDEPKTNIPIPSITPPSISYPTPAPLPMSVISSCPVSLPNLSESPDPTYISVENGYGNPEQTMFIGLWKDGVVYFCPNCAGDLSSNSRLGMKFWFYRTVPGEVIFEGRKVDEAGPEALLDSFGETADGYGDTGFHSAGLVFPGQGCWEITARIGEDQITFVTLVIWVPFDPLWPGWFPVSGLVFDGPDLSGYPTTFGLFFNSEEDGKVIVQTSQTKWEDTDLSSVKELVKVGENAGTCIIEEGNGLTSGALIWSSEDLNYRIQFENLELTCHDLLQMADS
ncbi:MAG: hypothetical protein Q7U53_09790 [Anaerolineaceae bacterium]|nr:hypothetical protein [Anaerolineaceae bacterium]